MCMLMRASSGGSADPAHGTAQAVGPERRPVALTRHTVQEHVQVGTASSSTIGGVDSTVMFRSDFSPHLVDKRCDITQSEDDLTAKLTSNRMCLL